MFIEDGTGTGKLVKVNSGNRLYTKAVTSTEDADINTSVGKVWSVSFEGLNPAGANDNVLYIKNTGDANLAISTIRLSVDTAASQIKVNSVSGTPSGGSAITPISRTVGSASLPTATIETGTDITGLTSEGTLYFIQCAAVDTQYELVCKSKIRIPKGKAISLNIETATANLTGTITLFEEEV
jgi:hypothetical protein